MVNLVAMETLFQWQQANCAIPKLSEREYFEFMFCTIVSQDDVCHWRPGCYGYHDNKETVP